MKPSAEWFEDLVGQTRSGLARYVERILASPEDAQEVVQEAYLKVFVALRNDPSESNYPVALLYTTARNIAISRLRHQSVVLKSVGAVTIAEELRIRERSAEQQVSASERLNSLLMVVDGLPPKCREVFVLRWIHGMPQRDIGEQLGISLSTVEKHLAKGLRHCKAMLTQNKPIAEQECADTRATAAS
jgi:RNA polymerase sigma-70 factor (ECF subfamily)